MVLMLKNVESINSIPHFPIQHFIFHENKRNMSIIEVFLPVFSLHSASIAL